MKSLLISIILILAYAYGQYTVEVDPTCWPELNQTKVEFLDCLNLGRFDLEQVQMEVYRMVFQHEDDVEAVRQFALKYCNFGYESLKCLPIYFNITPSCQPIQPTLSQSLDRIVKRTLDFMCDNNAEETVQFIINNAIATIKENVNLAAACAEHTQNVTALPTNDDAANLIRFCDAINQSLRCHLDWMEPTGKTHMMNFINTTNLIFAQEIGCTTA